MKVKPLNDMVIIKNIENIYHDFSLKHPNIGEVVSIANNKNQNIKVGDKVIYSMPGYTRLLIDDEEYIILPESHILAIWEE